MQRCISKAPANTVAGGTLVMPALALLSPLKLPLTLYFVSLGNSRGSWWRRKKINKCFFLRLRKDVNSTPALCWRREVYQTLILAKEHAI